MKIKSLLFISLILSFLMQPLAFANTDNVFFEGRLVNDPCIILSDHKTLTVNFKTVDIKALRKGEKTESIPFSIKLSQCDNTIAKNISFLFKGYESDALKGFLGVNVNGKTSGIGIGLQDKNGSFIAINKDNRQYELNKNDNEFLFYAYLKADPEIVKSKDVELGSFNTVATFYITYP